jgi:hypothetical protein
MIGAARRRSVAACAWVLLSHGQTFVAVRISHLRNPCTHILKFQSPHFEFLVENERAMTEPARRAGPRAAPIRIVDFGEQSLLRGRSLVVAMRLRAFGI